LSQLVHANLLVVGRLVSTIVLILRAVQRARARALRVYISVSTIVLILRAVRIVSTIVLILVVDKNLVSVHIYYVKKIQNKNNIFFKKIRKILTN